MRSDVKTGLFAGIVIAVAGVVFFAVHKKKSTTPLPALPVAQQSGDVNQTAPHTQSPSGNANAGKVNPVGSPTGGSALNRAGTNSQTTGLAMPGSSPSPGAAAQANSQSSQGPTSVTGDKQSGRQGNISPDQGSNVVSPPVNTSAGKGNTNQSGVSGIAGGTGNNSEPPVDANKAKVTPPVPVVPVEPALAKMRYYTVTKGDTLYKIAESYYGQGKYGNIIYQANRNIIKNPNILKPGWKLRIPYPSEILKQQQNH